VSNKEIAETNMIPLEESDGSELKKASAEMNLQFNKPAAKKEETKKEEVAEVAPQVEPEADKVPEMQVQVEGPQMEKKDSLMP